MSKDRRLTPMQAALKAREARVRDAVQELRLKVRTFRSNVEKIGSPSLAPRLDVEQSPLPTESRDRGTFSDGR